MRIIIVAIDGPAASGKSTLARNLASRLNLIHVDSGAFYRAITWKFLEKENLTLNSLIEPGWLEEFKFSATVDGSSVALSVEGKILNSELRERDVNASVALVARHLPVRAFVTRELHRIAASFHCVVEGRDIGSVVFPLTPFKIFLDAPLHVRVGRRNAQGLTDCLSSRDNSDRTRESSPLKATDDALHLYASDKSANEILDDAVALLEARGLQKSSLSYFA
jgi:cytidylate kinase